MSRFAGKASLILKLDAAASGEMRRALREAQQGGDANGPINVATHAAQGFREAESVEVPAGQAPAGF